MKIGLLTQNFGGFPETGRSARACVDLAVYAEGTGFDSVWVTDHIVLPADRRAAYPHNDSGYFPYRADQDIFEPLVLMGALATATSRVEIGVAVLVIPYRHPLTTAKMLATIDQLSGGRVILGAGVGWLRDEFDALGLPEEHYVRRGAVTVEYLQVMREAWTAPASFRHDGEFVQFDEIGALPRPARDPLPVWIGGKGPQALRRAARLGQGYLAISSTPSLLREEVAALRALDPNLTVGLIDGIAITDQPLGPDRSPLRGTPEQIVDGLAAFADAGLDHLVAGIRLDGDASFAGAQRALDLAAEHILPAAHTLPSAVLGG